jgi:hypothetical protein
MLSSKKILIISYLFITIVSFFYYPKWKIWGTEGTISWDVSGYYWYLPAVFIYKDVKKLEFSKSALEKYNPTPDYQQASPLPNGNYVLKYSSGMAVQYLPFFTVAHLLAKPLGFEADGFTKPYQFALQLGGVLMCMLGLFYFRKMLLFYFSDKTVSIVLISYVFATNYLNYAAIDNAMSHNWLFTWYCILIYTTHRFYQTPSRLPRDVPSVFRGILIGFIVGLCALTRPTDIISCLIPLFWGVNAFRITAFQERFQYIFKNLKYYMPAIITAALVGSIQLFYWKYVSGDWFVYSYGDQKFSWLRPHTYDYMFKFRCGWLIYTPIMAFSLIGIYYLIKKRLHIVALVPFILLNIYIVTAWDIWWYGGRAMVQSYPVLAFPFAAFIEYFDGHKVKKSIIYALTALFVYYNIWWTHGVHLGGIVDAYGMTQAYWFKVVGRFKVNPDVVKLYDTNEYFDGTRKDVQVIYENNFNTDTALIQAGKKIHDSPAEYVNTQRQYTKNYDVPLSMGTAKWLRASATFRCMFKEWDNWRMAQFIVRFKKDDSEVKGKMIKLHRFLDNGDVKTLYIDTKLPKKDFNKVSIILWNAESGQELLMDDLKVETFNE